MGMDYEHLQRAINHQNFTDGLAKGHAEGRAEEKRETARKLMAKGMSVTDIAEITGLSIEVIQSL